MKFLVFGSRLKGDAAVQHRSSGSLCAVCADGISGQCGNVLGSQLEFASTVPISNPLGIADDTEITPELMKDINKVYKLPPVLIQLCSLYDKQNGDDMTEYFLDALLNILICMAYLNSGKDQRVNEFIQAYYSKVSYYVLERTPAEHSRFLARKLHGEKIQCDVEKKVPPVFEWYEPEEDMPQEQHLEEVSDRDGEMFSEEEAPKEAYQEEEPEEDFEEEDEFLQEEEEEDPEDTEDGTEQYGTGGTAAAALSGGGKQEAVVEKTLEEQEAEISAQAKAQFLLVKKGFRIGSLQSRRRMRRRFRSW